MTPAELRAIHEAATPGPWANLNDYEGGAITARCESTGDDSDCILAFEWSSHEDRAVTVAARNALPALLALWEAAKAWQGASAPCDPPDPNCPDCGIVAALAALEAL